MLAVFAALVAWPGAASAASGVDITATEGSSITKRVADIDSCVFDHATIDWGDGTSSAGQFETGNPPGVKGTHTYAEEGTFHGSVTYTTDCTTDGTVNFTATVGDAPIAAQGRDIGPIPGQPFIGVVSHVTDQNPGASPNDFTALVDWGDGNQSAGTVSAAPGGGFDVTGTHTYQHGGDAAVNVTVTDVGGSTASSSSTAHIATLLASFGWSPTNPCQEKPLHFDTSGSQGPIVTYRWSFTDFFGAGQPAEFDLSPTDSFPALTLNFPSWPSPTPYYWPQVTEVHLLRPPTTGTLTVLNGSGQTASAQHTVTFANPDVTYVVKVTTVGWGYYQYPSYYLVRKNPGVCVPRILPLIDARPVLSSDPVTLGAALTATVSCGPVADCVGTLYALRPGQANVPPSRRAAAAARRNARAGPNLGRTTFFVPAGSKRKVRIRLNKAGRRLARARRLKRVTLVMLTRGHKPRARTVRVRRRKR